MAPKLICESLEALPESLRASAVHKDGSYQVDGTPLLRKHDELSRENQHFRSVFARIGHDDPGAVRTALEELDRRRESDREAQQATSDAERRVESERKIWQAERDALVGKVVEHELTAAITRVGGNVRLLLPHIEPSIRSEVRNGDVRLLVVDSAGNPKTDVSGLPLSLDAVINSLKNDGDFGAAFSASAPQQNVTQGTAQQGVQAFTPPGRIIQLTRQEAKNPRIYQAAVKEAGGVDNVRIGDK